VEIYFASGQRAINSKRALFRLRLPYISHYSRIQGKTQSSAQRVMDIRLITAVTLAALRTRHLSL